MIRINLLKMRAESNDPLPPALDARGTPSRFLTKRELVLALALMAFGGAIIATQAFGIFQREPTDDTPLVAASEAPAAPAPPVSAPPPTSVPPAAEPAPVVPSEPPVAEPPAPAAAPSVTSAPSAQERPEREFGDEPNYIVSALKLVPSGPAIEVLAEVQGQPEYRSFWLSNPVRLVIDLEDAELRVPPDELSQPGAHPLLRQVRAAQNTFEPPLVRIVVEPEGEGPVELTTGAAGISVKLSPAP